MTVEPLACTTIDGLTLEAEFAAPNSPPTAAAVLCHPDPQQGGTMRSIVISALFGALPAAGVAVIRFNYRGVEASEGVYDGGEGERDDARAALDALLARLGPAAPPTWMVGWSFGGGIALSIDDPRLAGWIGIAPSLGSGDPGAVRADHRPKLIVVAAHDQLIDPEETLAAVADWNETTTATVPGADHFFIGRTDRVNQLAIDFIRTGGASAG